MFEVFRRGVAVLVTSASVSFAPAAFAETLTDALISAYKNSGLLEQNRALLRATDEGMAVAVAALRPVISYALSAGWQSTYNPSNPLLSGDSTSASATLSASLLLYDFGRSQLGIDTARENVMATRDMLKGVEQTVLLRAVSAYLNMRDAQQTVSLQSNNVALIGQELRAAQDRFEVGEITQTEVALAQARLAAAKSAEAAAQGNLMIAREEYRAAVGRYPGSLEPPPRAPATAGTLDEAKRIARSRHPDMLSAQHNAAVADLNVELALAAMKPTLSASASSSLQSGGSTSNRISLSLSGPLYQGGKLTALYRRSIAQRDAALSGLHLAGIGVDQNVGNAWARLAIAAASIEASEQQVNATREALRGTREEASLGARTTLDVLNAEQDLLDAQAGAISAQSDQYLAVYALLAAMGLLSVEHLKLGIPTYDPEAYYNAVKDAPTTLVSPEGAQLDQVLKALGRD